MEPKLETLKTYLYKVHDLTMATSVLGWDQETYMPPGGATARAQQLGTLSALAHETFASDEVGQLLDDLKSYEASLPYDSDDASLIRVAQREYARRRRVPAEFVARQTHNQSLTYAAWLDARAASDFDSIAPWLQRQLDLSREYASFFPEAAHPADPLIDLAEPLMSAAEIRRVFAELRAELVPLVHSITSQPVADDSCLKQYYPEASQLAFGVEVAKQIGYDFNRGRQDKTAHPFMTMFSIDDVRMTIRVKENNLTEALFGTLHEGGHALYGQGHDHALARTLLAEGASSGIHESQSRLWENLVGRSRRFWQYFYPRLQQVFPAQLGNVSLDTFYRAINKVERSLIRTDADEVTYNLHVMMRFEFELLLLEGKLSVRDLPDVWSETITRDIGVTPPDHAMGVLQDVHWYSGAIGGMFQGYTLGNILSAQFFDAAVRAHPEIPDQITRGEFQTLLGWLQENIYKHGSKFTPDELIPRATGEPLNIKPYIRYLTDKYSELYSL